MIRLHTKDWKVYNYLLHKAALDMNYWVSKEEIIQEFPELFTSSDATSHDVCSTLNAIRLRLNKARAEGQLTHLVLLDNHKFKLATSEEEVEKYCKRDKENGIKLLVRYYQNIGVLKTNGQGKLIDCKGNVIDENSLAKRITEPFEF
jgi:hypothetical protein